MHDIGLVPNLFIIGAPKAGTTAFVSSLAEHPDIFVPKEKEPRFFDAPQFFDYKEDYPYKTLDEYLQLYKNKDAMNSIYRVDGSVFNMYSIESIRKILEVSPDAKFILILRDPLAATKSMFSQRMKYIIPQLREINEDFNKCWQLSKTRKDNKNYPKGCRNKLIFRYDLLFSYEKYLPDIINEINNKDLLICSYHEYSNNPLEFFDKVFAFLGLQGSVKLSNERKNSSLHSHPNLLGKILASILFKTAKLRKKIGFNGRNYPALRRFLAMKDSKPIIISNKSDEDIRNFFSDTYDYAKKNNIRF